jgi:hypothetical protein
MHSSDLASIMMPLHPFLINCIELNSENSTPISTKKLLTEILLAI